MQPIQPCECRVRSLAVGAMLQRLRGHCVPTHELRATTQNFSPAIELDAAMRGRLLADRSPMQFGREDDTILRARVGWRLAGTAAY